MPKQTFFGKEIRRDIRDTQVTQIFLILVDEIAAGRWAINSRFPSVTQLVNQSGLSRGSLQKVLARLERAGLVATESRRGTFVVAFEPSQPIAPDTDESPASPEHTPHQEPDPAPLDQWHDPDTSQLEELAEAAFRTTPARRSPIPEPATNATNATPPPPETRATPTPLDDPFTPFSQPAISPPRATASAPPPPLSPAPPHVARIGIALIKSDPRIQNSPHTEGGSLLEALLETVRDFGYRSSVAFIDRSPDWDIIADANGPFDDPVDGIIAIRSGGFIDLSDPAPESCPIVFIAGAETRSLPAVTSDIFLGSYRTTRDIIAQGHCRILACPDGSLRQPPGADAFLDGHREALHRVGLPACEDAISLARGLRPGDFASLRQFLDLFRDATAILCENPRFATDLIALCDAIGIAVPSDLSIATCSRTLMRGDSSGETISGFEFPPENLAHAALLLLDEILHTGSSRFTQVRIPPSKILGDSCAPPRR